MKLLSRISLLILVLAGCESSSPSFVPGMDVETDGPAWDVTTTTANCAVWVHNRGAPGVTSQGVCWGKDTLPSLSDHVLYTATGIDAMKVTITGLAPGTKYYVRGFAINRDGTTYGNCNAFRTKPVFTETVHDIDGNEYHTVVIGQQIWLVENLRTTHFNDGTPIPVITDASAWSLLAAPGCCWYKNDKASFGGAYGALYNWSAIGAGTLAPAGWHVATYNDWITLIEFQAHWYGGYQYAGSSTGGTLKEKGTLHWMQPNTGADNSSGFTALPGGFRYSDGAFNSLGYYGDFWAADKVWSLTEGLALGYDNPSSWMYDYDSRCGFSVRCVKDE